MNEKDLDKAYELDLDSLVGDPVKVKFSKAPEGFIMVYPPDVEDFFRLESLRSKLGNSTQFSEDEIKELMSALRQILSNSVPYVKENGLGLKFNQLLALMGYVMRLAQPAEDAALGALGIEKASAEDPDSEKKAESDLVS